ncbi:MAG TPA: Lrp/AsnC family transcriptional regulator [Thermoanaerobaculia bacterium]|nr:Lrp/AsnC family transcriptional regulator [Thermoanaerobaculia bacterium]
MAVELDELDRRIVALLLKDGRTPAAQIAEQIGLSRPAVADRLDKLERQGVIRGTTAVVDPTALGRSITAFVAARGASLTSAGRKKFRELMRREEMLEVHTVAGDDCYLIKVRTGSIGELNTLVQQLTAAPISFATRTTIVMETHSEKVGGIDLGQSLSESRERP